MVIPVVTGVVFDSVIPGADRSQLLVVTLLLIVAAVCGRVSSSSRASRCTALESRMDASLQAAVWDRLLSLPVPFFRDYTSGDLAMRSLGISAMRRIVTDSVTHGALGHLLGVQLRPALLLQLAAGSAGDGPHPRWRSRRRCRATSSALSARSDGASGRLSGMLLQLVNGVSKLRVSATENRAFAAWAREFSRRRSHAPAQARRIGLSVFTAVIPVLRWRPSSGRPGLLVSRAGAFDGLVSRLHCGLRAVPVVCARFELRRRLASGPRPAVRAGPADPDRLARDAIAP